MRHSLFHSKLQSMMRIVFLLSVISVLIGSETSVVTSFTCPRLVDHSSIWGTRTTPAASRVLTCMLAAPEPLETEGDWTAYLDFETTGLVYYFNSRTGESLWEPPTGTFPQVYLTPRNRRRAERLREAYLKTQRQQQQKQEQAQATVPEEKKVSILSTILDSKRDAVPVVARQEPDWFAGLLEEASKSKEVAPRVAVETKKTVVKEVEEPNWFASLFEAVPKKSSSDAPNWFENLFDSPPTTKRDTPKTAKKEEPNWFESLFDVPKRSNDEPNWFASIFDDTQMKGKSVDEDTATIVTVDEPPSVEQQQKPPTWVKDSWLGGSTSQQPPPVQGESKPAPALDDKGSEPGEDDKAEKRKGRKLLSILFGRGKKDGGEPVDEGGAAVINGDLDTTMSPPEETVADKKSKAKGKGDVAVKERPAKQDVVKEKVERKIEVAPRKTVEIKPAEPKIVVKEKEVPIKIDMSAYVLPHPMKMLWGGEDAVFTQGRTFGVFDGVSGANKTDGVALYSRTMASQMRKAVGNGGLSTDMLQEFMIQAVVFADARATGATTALVASIDEKGYLNALNVGDSTCIVVRDGKVVAQTREKVHYYECPYQLGKGLPDTPRDGSKLRTKLQRGDIVVMASDGVFDNLSENEVVKVVSTAPPRSSLMAKRIVDLSRRISLNPNAETPFAKIAKKNGDPFYTTGLGGKLDDVSCVVVRYH